jgi:hypothetical protein
VFCVDLREFSGTAVESISSERNNEKKSVRERTARAVGVNFGERTAATSFAVKHALQLSRKHDCRSQALRDERRS